MTGERAIIGIDPGLGGALARYWPKSQALQIADMPTLNVGKGKSNKRVIDEYALARLIDDWAPSAACVWLEQVGVRPGEGGVGAFTFGRGYGLIRGICAANFLTIHDVTPQSWKKTLRVAGDKDQARQRAAALFPRHAQHWTRKCDDGRAEASMIALYGAGRQLTEAAA